MNFNDIAVFVDLYESSSISAAARKRGLTQPAITQKLQKLELDFGVSLFDRSQKGLSPTNNAQNLIETARAIVQTQNRFITLCGKLKAGKK